MTRIIETEGRLTCRRSIVDPCHLREMPLTVLFDLRRKRKLASVPSEKKRGNNRHVKRCSPVNIDGRRKAKVAQNDQPIAERDENCNGEDYCGGTPVSPQEERQDYKTRKDVANSLGPHKRKGGGVVDRNAVGS